MGLAELAVVMEALGRTLAPEPFLSTVLLAGRALLLGGSEAQQERWLAKIAAGEALLSLAQQERRSRYDLHRVEARAEASGAGFRLSGEKIQVLDGHVSDAFVVVARSSGAVDDRAGISLFLLEKGASGLSVERQHRVDDRNAALLKFDGVELGADALLGRQGEGLALLERVVDGATAGLCAEMLGSMSEAFERTLEYMKQRVQFGVPIGSFQALKHRAAEVFIQIELSRSAVMAAARAVDADASDAAQQVSLAKARCSDTAILVANEALQMHGGIGMTDEHDIGFYFKRARTAELTFGDAAWHRERWARLSRY
jgi:acyl-CoA dehydrogenase